MLKENYIEFVGISLNQLILEYHKLTLAISEAEGDEYTYIRSDCVRDARLKKLTLKRKRMDLADFLLTQYNFDVLDGRTRKRYYLE